MNASENLCNKCQRLEECVALTLSPLLTPEQRLAYVKKYYHNPQICPDDEGREAMGLEVANSSNEASDLRQKRDSEYMDNLESAINELIPVFLRVGVPKVGMHDFSNLHPDIQQVLLRHTMQDTQEYLSLFQYVRVELKRRHLGNLR